MIELRPLEDTDKIKEFYETLGFPYNEFSGVVVATERGNKIGFCLYDLTDKKMLVKKIEPIVDIPLADGILRSSLHVAAERSIMDAFYEGEELESLCEKINFIKSKEEKSLKIDKLFSSCSSCGG